MTPNTSWVVHNWEKVQRADGKADLWPENCWGESRAAWENVGGVIERSSSAIKVSSCPTAAAQGLTAGNCGCNAPCCGCWQLPVMCSAVCVCVCEDGHHWKKCEICAIWSWLSTSVKLIINHLNKPEDKNWLKKKTSAIGFSELCWNIHDTHSSAVLMCSWNFKKKKKVLEIPPRAPVESDRTCKSRLLSEVSQQRTDVYIFGYCAWKTCCSLALGGIEAYIWNIHFQHAHGCFDKTGEPDRKLLQN